MKTKKLLNVLMLFVLSLGLFAMTIPSAHAATELTNHIEITRYNWNQTTRSYSTLVYNMKNTDSSYTNGQLSMHVSLNGQIPDKDGDLIDESQIEFIFADESFDFSSGDAILNGNDENTYVVIKVIKGSYSFQFSNNFTLRDIYEGEELKVNFWSDDSYVNLNLSDDSNELDINQSLTMIATNKTKPAISGKDTIINNVSSPYTVAQLKDIAQIKVLDAYDGDITSKLQVKTDSYTANKSSVGTSTVSYTVTNSGGLSTEYVLTVLTKDLTAPSISGPLTSRIPYHQTITSADIIAKYIVSDNYDTAVTLVVESTDYVAGKVGTYTYNLKATDKAGNSATAVHTLSTYDDVVPVITNSMTGAWKVPFKTQITDTLLLSNLTANDAIDGNLTSRIKVKTSDVVPGKLGLYTVTYEVVDNAGNVGTFTRPFEIITLDYPVYYVAGNIISIEDANKLTIDQIAQMYAELNNIDMHSYTVMTNEYFGNEATPGEYLLAMKITDKKGKSTLLENFIQVTSLDASDDVKEDFNLGKWMAKNPIWVAVIIISFLSLIVVGIVVATSKKDKNKPYHPNRY